MCLLRNIHRCILGSVRPRHLVYLPPQGENSNTPEDRDYSTVRPVAGDYVSVLTDNDQIPDSMHALHQSRFVAMACSCLSSSSGRVHGVDDSNDFHRSVSLSSLRVMRVKTEFLISESLQRFP